MSINSTQFLKIETPIIYMGNKETEPPRNNAVNIIFKDADQQAPYLVYGHSIGDKLYWREVGSQANIKAEVGDMWFPRIQRA